MKRILPFATIVVILGMCSLVVGCSGEEQVDDKKITNDVNKNLEGMPPASEEGMADIGSKKAGGK